MTFGRRGRRDCILRLPTWESKRELLQIPGVGYRPGKEVECTYDLAPYLAETYGARFSWPKLRDLEDGRRQCRELDLNHVLRPYQREAAAFLADRSYALLVLPMRCGKTPAALAAAVLAGARRILIVCPALIKRQWAQEVSKFTRRRALIVSGRSASEAYWLPAEGARRKWLREEALAQALAGDTNPDVIDLQTRQPAAGNAPLVLIINFEILQGQQSKDAAGVVHDREDLKGWTDRIRSLNFDVAILDEVQLISSRMSKRNREGKTRRDRTAAAVEKIPQVWGLTGTPFDGSVVGLWGIVDTLSNGAASATKDRRTSFDWEVRYCDAAHVEEDIGGGQTIRHWKVGARGPLAETELKARLSVFAMIRKRKDILKDLPAKTRQVITIEAADVEPVKSDIRSAEKKDSRIHALRRATLHQKIPTVVERVKEELAAGEKSIVFAYFRSSVDALAKALDKALSKLHVSVYSGHGEMSADARAVIAEKFREDPRPSVIVATIDSFPLGIRLDPAAHAHFVECHFKPTTMMQAEDRPYLPGVTRGLTISYYAVEGSVDEHLIKRLLPKLETLAKVLDDDAAADMQSTLTKAEAEVSLSELWADLIEGVDLDDVEDV